MDEIRIRLGNCFAAVFPTLSREEIARADHHSVSGWDSVASVTLFATAQDAQSAIERTKEYAVMKGHNWNTEENRIRPVTSQTLFSETVQCVGCKRQVKKSDSSEYYGAYVCHDCVPA